MLNRRRFLTGLSAVVAAPAIVRAGLIMPIQPKLVVPPSLVLPIIEGRATWSGGPGASFSGNAWNVAEFFSDDVEERWARLKQRHAAQQLAEIEAQYGQPVRTDG